MAILISTSATQTKSLRGATAHIAKSSIKVEDDTHESNIKKGEKFYLKVLGKRYYLIDVEGKYLYQFKLKPQEYAKLAKTHPKADDNKTQKASKAKSPKASPNGKKRPKSSGNTKLPAASDPEVKKAISNIREIERMASNDKDVGDFLRAQHSQEYNKQAMEWDDPDKEQLQREASQLKKKIASLRKKPQVKRYLELKGDSGDGTGALKKALYGKDPNYTKQRDLHEAGFQKGSTRSMKLASKKMREIISNYLNAK